MDGNSHPWVVQRLGLRAFTAKGTGSTPGLGTKILQAPRSGKKPRKPKNYLLREDAMKGGGPLLSDRHESELWHLMDP